MRYQITVRETTIKIIDIRAESIDEAKAKGLAAAKGLKPDFSGRTEVYGFRVHDEREEE